MTGGAHSLAPRLRLTGLRSPLVGPFGLAVSPGECVAISGASGAGKSLFLRMIADLDPNRGEVWLDGVARSVTAATDWRRRAPYVAAESGWWADAVPEHFARYVRAEAKETAARLGVEAAVFDGPVARLSTGERQRLALVRALVLHPPLMLLDEPTGPLDPLSVSRVEQVLVERLKEGMALVLVSHDPRQAERLNARRFIMLKGRLEPTP